MAFDNQYLVSDGPINAKTGEAFGRTTKSYSDWLATQTKEVLSCKDYGFITKLQKSVWTLERILSRKPRTLRELNEAWFGTYTPPPQHYDGHRYYVESEIMLSIF